MAWISPELAQHFMPVQRSCEDECIRLEVVSAYIHGDTAEVYFTLQDLTVGRLDEHTHIDSFNISSGRDDSTLGTCPLVGYDPQTQTDLHAEQFYERRNGYRKSAHRSSAFCAR